MSTPYRKRYLFPRSLKEVVHAATQPLMGEQHQMLALLLRDWSEIVGANMARQIMPAKVVFSKNSTQDGVLTLKVPAHLAPEIPYMSPQILEQLARYIGYQAITRITVEISR